MIASHIRYDAIATAVSARVDELQSTGAVVGEFKARELSALAFAFALALALAHSSVSLDLPLSSLPLPLSPLPLPLSSLLSPLSPTPSLSISLTLSC